MNLAKYNGKINGRLFEEYFWRRTERTLSPDFYDKLVGSPEADGAEKIGFRYLREVVPINDPPGEIYGVIVSLRLDGIMFDGMSVYTLSEKEQGVEFDLFTAWRKAIDRVVESVIRYADSGIVECWKPTKIKPKNTRLKMAVFILERLHQDRKIVLAEKIEREAGVNNNA